MKSKLSMKILGVVVIIATLASLLVGVTAAPVSAAVGTMSYGSVSAPGNSNNVLGGTVYHLNVGGSPDGFAITGTPIINFLEASPDGTTMFAWDNAAGMLYTSTNAGVSWTPRPYTGTNLLTTGGGLGLQTAVIKMLVSPNYATDNTIVLVTAANIYVSANAGLSFSAAPTPPLEGGIITSADIGLYYADGNVPSVIIGCTGGGAVAVSNVLRFKLSGSYAWSEIGSLKGAVTVTPYNPGDLSVYGVAFSKNNSLDSEILAVTDSVVGAGGGVPQLMSSFTNAAFTNAKALGATNAAAATRAIIALGSDYNGFASGNTVAIGLSGTALGAGDDVYRINGRSSGSAGSGPALDCDLGGAATASAITDLLWNGPMATGTVLVGTAVSPKVYSNSTFPTGTTVTFAGGSKPPTGTAVSGVAVAGTTYFVATTGADGGISASTAGSSWNQLSLINVGAGSGNPAATPPTSTIDRMSIVSLNALDANNMFLIMANTAIGYAGRQLWTTSNGGTAWTRVLTSAGLGVGGGIAFVSPSPAYATDKTFFVSQGTLGTTSNVYMTVDNGATFTPMIASDFQTAFKAINNTTFYYGGATAATFFKFGRWASGSFPAGVATTVTSIAFNPTDTTNATIAVGMSDGTVYLSTNDGVTFTKLAAGGATVAYGPDGSLYALSGTNIYRYVASTTSFLPIQATTTGTGLVITKDGTLYASDSNSLNGVWRSLNPTKGDVTGVTACEFQTINTAAFTSDASVYAFTGISVVNTATDNTLYLLSNTPATGGTTSGASSGYAGSLKGFKDTFIVGPTLTSPANGALLTSQTSAALAWTAFANTNTYEVGVNDASAFNGVDFSGDSTANKTTTKTTFTNKGNPTSGAMAQGTTYYWRLRAKDVMNGAVVGPIWSRYSTPTWSFITALTPPAASTPMFPLQGATLVAVDTTFTWPASTVPGATYEFVLAEDLGNVDKFAIIDYSATCPTNATVLRETLKYDTVYWWRVRTVTGTSKSDWTTSFFTTAPEPPTTISTTTAPPVTVTNTSIVITQTQTTLTVSNPPAEKTSVIPPYLLWAVIAVGAILVIAVIVLIVRTRKI